MKEFSTSNPIPNRRGGDHEAKVSPTLATTGLRADDPRINSTLPTPAGMAATRRWSDEGPRASPQPLGDGEGAPRNGKGNEAQACIAGGPGRINEE